MKGATPKRWSRGISIVGALALTSLLGAVAATTTGVQPAAAAVQGCSYADNSANNGKYASTICWFDFSAFNQATARAAGGQPMEVRLEGGFVATFTAVLTDVAGTSTMTMQPRSTPLESRFAFGTDAYRGVVGSDTVYSDPGPFQVRGAQLSFDNIQVLDSSGNAVTGYAFVAADTEDNVAGESFAWSSDQPLNEIERLAPNGSWGCKAPVGLGTTQVSCAGTGGGGSSTAGGKSTALLVAAENPSVFATEWRTPQQSGIAIGIQTAKLTLDKVVNGRVDPADSFDLSVLSPEGTVAGSATTGITATASTGGISALSRTAGSYTLSEGATAGSPALLSNYSSAWSCVNAASGSSTTLPSGPGTTQTVDPAIGDDITCTVTNTAHAATLGIVKHAAAAVDVNGNGQTDAGDTIQYTFTVTNTGELTMSGIGVTDAKVGAVSCPSPALAVGASELCTADNVYAITEADILNGGVDNSATAFGTPPGSAVVRNTPPSTTHTPTAAPAPALSIVKSASPTAPADFQVGELLTYSFAVTNTGNVTLTNVTVVEGAFTGSGTLGAPSCPAGAASLAPGAQVVCTATYTVTQPDVDAGSIQNTATAEGTPPGAGAPVPSPPSSLTVPEPANPGILMVKTADVTTIARAGQAVTYSFAVTNTGNTLLRNLKINETSFNGGGSLSAVVCPAGVTQLVPGQVMVCTAGYTAVAADLRKATLVNTATASAVPPGGAPIVSAPSTAEVDAPLAWTGGTIRWGVGILAIALILSGAVVLIVLRRARGKRLIADR